MPRRGSVSEQLEIPLVWETEPPPPAPRGPEPPPRPKGGEPRRGWGGRALAAALADVGVALLLVAASGGVALAAGAQLTAPQLLLAAMVGGLAAALLVVAGLWAWRGTVGMLLVGLQFSLPLGLVPAVRVGLLWLGGAVLVGVPLLVGRSLLERAAGAALTFQSPPAGA